MQTHTQTPLCLIFKVDAQQGPAVWHRELCSVLGGSLDGRGVWGRMDTCICMAESICYAPETITTLLAGYTPIQNLKTKTVSLHLEWYFKVLPYPACLCKFFSYDPSSDLQNMPTFPISMALFFRFSWAGIPSTPFFAISTCQNSTNPKSNSLAIFSKKSFLYHLDGNDPSCPGLKLSSVLYLPQSYPYICSFLVITWVYVLPPLLTNKLPHNKD